MASKKVWVSFGAMDGVLAFLEPIERILLQLANRFAYDIAISRVET